VPEGNESLRIEIQSKPAYDIEEAKNLQLKLAGEVVQSGNPLPDRICTIAGVDASISRDNKSMIGSVVLFNWPKFELLSIMNCTEPVFFPYIPEYLSFRELPVILSALDKLTVTPDLIIVDGHGTAHPRRIGIASHLGVVTGLVTIGCAKRRLTGSCEEIGTEKGEFAHCIDRGDRIGSVVRTRNNVSPVWVSAGHLIDQDAAVHWVLRTVTKYRLPEPIRAAHQAASRFRKAN